MPSYREITLPGEARRPRTAAASRPAGSAAWRAAVAGTLADAAAFCRANPGAVLGGLAAVGAAGAICYNALEHQSGRHPAPILPKVAAAPKAPPAVAARAEPAGPAGRAAARDPAWSDAKPASSPPASSSPASSSALSSSPPSGSPATAPSRKSAARDPIGDLIRSEDTTASVTPRADKAGKSETRAEARGSAEAPVMRAQRALDKLGYGPLRADGLMGANTRAAIERFERARKLPVTGEPAGKTLRALLARAAEG